MILWMSIVDVAVGDLVTCRYSVGRQLGDLVDVATWGIDVVVVLCVWVLRLRFNDSAPSTGVL